MYCPFKVVNYENGETISISSDVYTAAVGCVFDEDCPARVRCYDLQRAKEIGSQVLVFEYAPGSGFSFEGEGGYVDAAFTAAIQTIVDLESEISQLRTAKR